MPFPTPDTLHPITLPDGSVHQGTVFLQAAIDHPRWQVGRYTYASAHTVPDNWAMALAPYLYGGNKEKLVLGSFCQIAHGVQFITSSANHRMDGISTYPFAVFDGLEGGIDYDRPSMPTGKRDTLIGHDVWIGTGATILPGATIGNGVIVGAGAVVSGTVPDYAIVAGNRAEVVKMRFDDETIARINALAWWDWPMETILANEAAIVGADVDALEAVAETN
ncbi:CatB-related O-acetyltransferase [Ahrensia marina]|uniref:CatB-related O-acetyltransferase n=1 Tax=Ahrensia marina TaxID=1514904 RepID=UPI0035CE9505